MKYRKIIRAGTLTFFLEISMLAATLPPDFSEAPAAAGFINNSTAFEFAPDGRLFILEQSGAVRIIKGGVLLSTPLTSFPVDSSGERGLLGIAFDPNFPLRNTFTFTTLFQDLPATTGSSA